MTNGTQMPVEPVQAQPVGPVQPHRGAMILVFGILGLLCCFIFGIVAWAMGSADLKEMDAGRMDPSGRGLTQAGQICGIISAVLGIGQIILAIMWSMGAMSAMRLG